MTEKQQAAAPLVAAGKLTLEKIAVAVGVSRRTITTWKADERFQAAVREARGAWRKRARGQGAADPDWRLRNLNDRYKRLRAVIEDRARDPQMRKVRGGRTGLIAVTYKMQSLGDGVSAPVPEYAVDTGMLAEMRAIEQQVAIEMDQWKQKAPQAGDTTIHINILMERLRAGIGRVAAIDDGSRTNSDPIQPAERG